MAVQLILTPELQERLRREAERRHVSIDMVAVQLLDKHLPALNRQDAAVAMLQQWQAEDAAMTAEDAAGNATILRAIDADRLSDRKLFTDVLNEGPS